MKASFLPVAKMRHTETPGGPSPVDVGARLLDNWINTNFSLKGLESKAPRSLGLDEWL